MKYEGFPETNPSKPWYGGLKLRKYPQKLNDSEAWVCVFLRNFGLSVSRCDEVRRFTTNRKKPTDARRNSLYRQIKYLHGHISERGNP